MISGRSLSLVVGLSAVLLGAQAQAGASTAGTYTCTRNADFSGSCSGTFLAARNGINISDQVNFNMDTTGRLVFGALYLGNTYGCSKMAAAGSLDVSIWTAASTGRNYFAVSWNAQGVCTWVYLLNSSAYQGLPQ